MATFRIEITTDNAAFEDNPEELSEILGDIARRTSVQNPRGGTVQDSNGNSVGRFWFSEEN